MSGIKNIIGKAKYAWMRKSLSSLPYGEQRAVALSVYEGIDETYRSMVGQNVGMCTVSFQCPYEGHVSYHCLRELSERKDDASDILVDYVLERTGDEDWVLTVVVATSDKEAHCAADAAAMKAVLSIPTVNGNFNRSYCKLPVVAGSKTLGGATSIS